MTLGFVQRRRRRWLVKIRQLGQIWARTGFHLENVGQLSFGGLQALKGVYLEIGKRQIF
jgi:hypothetical protein